MNIVPPKQNTIWYFESSNGISDWFRVIRIMNVTYNPNIIKIEIIDSNKDQKILKKINISFSEWQKLNLKNVSDDYPEYKL